jgi:hypothetical protein
LINYLASIKIPRILNLLILIFIFYTISFTIIPDESRASWDCFRALHKQAISDAVDASPADFKKVLVPLEDTMLKQVDVIQNTPKPDRKSFGSYFKNIVEAAKDSDPMRNEYMARNMVDITIYIFDAYCPLKISFCDENEILRRASVVYDGYSPNPDYTSIPSPAFDSRQQLSGEVTKMLSFYNTLVNEILDLWVTIWKDAGRDISGLPKENTLVRGAGTRNVDKTKSVKNLRSRDKLYDAHKYEYKTDQTTVNQIAEDRKRVSEIKMKIQEVEKEKKRAELAGGHNDDKRLDDELRRLFIEMDHLELRLIKRETD